LNSSLEHNLRNYQSLTIGDKIRVIFADHSFDFIVMELKPESAVSIIGQLAFYGISIDWLFSFGNGLNPK